jgi:uncharacterized protein
MSQVLDLYRLQKIDSRRDQISIRLLEIDKIISEDQTLTQAEAQSEKGKQLLHKNKTTLKVSEDAVRSQQLKIEETTSALYGGLIKNPKELQDLQQEIISIKKQLVKSEDQQLEAMISVEQAEAQFQLSLSNISVVKAQMISKHSTLIGEQTNLRKEYDKLDTERQAVISSISLESLKLYDRLRVQKRGIAVTTLKDSSCDSCGATLTRSEWQLARSPTQISYCPSCGRILYVD